MYANHVTMQGRKKLIVYILHSPRLTKRARQVQEIRQRLNSYSFKNINIVDVVVVIHNEPEDITANDIQTLVNYAPPEEEHLKQFSMFAKNLHINQLSQNMKHLFALKSIANNSSDIWGMILEDDILFQENDICPALDMIFQEIDKAKGPVLLGMPSTQQTSSDDVIVPVNREVHPLLPVVENYIVHKSNARILLDNFTPIKYFCNAQFNYIYAKTQMQLYQTIFTLFINGSRYGMFVSSANACNPLVFNADYMGFFELIKKIESKEITAQEAARDVVQYIGKAGQMSQHPDFLYLIGKYKVLQGKYKEAAKLLTKSLEEIEKDHGIVNHESWVLKDLIRLHKYTQE